MALPHYCRSEDSCSPRLIPKATYRRFTITLLGFFSVILTLYPYFASQFQEQKPSFWKKQSGESSSSSIFLSCVEQTVLTPGIVQRLTPAICERVDAARRHRAQSALQSADSTLT